MLLDPSLGSQSLGNLHCLGPFALDSSLRAPKKQNKNISSLVELIKSTLIIST
jgi:hypothetical protein